MKILDICTVKFSFTGIPVHIRNYYNLLKFKNTIDIVSENFNPVFLKTMPLHNGTHLYKLPRRRNPFIYLFKLRKIIKKGKYDIIHIHGNSATMALELFAARNCNAIKIVHTHNTKYKAKFLNRVCRPYLIKHANYFFAASDIAGEKLYGKNKFQVIINGIDESKFRFNSNEREKIRKKYKLKEKDILIGHIGWFNKQKNQFFIIKIAQLLRNNRKIKFMLIGDGDKGAFKNKIKSLHLENKFIILPATPKVNKFYSAFDVFILPSKYEGLGIVTVEAQISGLYCIVSNKVPKEAKISSRIYFLPLNNLSDWINNINNIISKNYFIRPRFSSNKYNIIFCAHNLNNFYKKCTQDNSKNF